MSKTKLLSVLGAIAVTATLFPSPIASFLQVVRGAAAIVPLCTELESDQGKPSNRTTCFDKE